MGTGDGPDAAAHDAASRFLAAGGTLYVVATPLGNLRDVTLRALDVLGSDDVGGAEHVERTQRHIAEVTERGRNHI